MKRRSHGVSGRNYVVHIVRSDGHRTLCGKIPSAVNCQGRDEPITEATCLLCAKAKRWHTAPVTSRIHVGVAEFCRLLGIEVSETQAALLEVAAEASARGERLVITTGPRSRRAWAEVPRRARRSE